jgi:hypothetical protein
MNGKTRKEKKKDSGDCLLVVSKNGVLVFSIHYQCCNAELQAKEHMIWVWRGSGCDL